MKIAIAGAGYVGLSLATLLSTKHEVTAFDVVPEKANSINKRISPIKDSYIEKFLSEKNLNLTATTDPKIAFSNADFAIVSTPTNYDDTTNRFDTSSVEDIIKQVITFNPSTNIIIKSTVPVGYTESARQKFKNNNIIFSPEFLREGKALYDNLYPSRIIVGDTTKTARQFGKILQEVALNHPPLLYMRSTEAEAVKLFANTYLALRIAYFNELDTYAEIKNLNTKNIIAGVSSDPRIGDYYNNPSFGYGGYCLPKDTKQLLSNYADVPQNLIEAIVKANTTRKSHITNTILSRHPHTVGIYRLIMKTDSDNFRSSAIQDIIANLRQHDINIIVYEPTLSTAEFDHCKVINNFSIFTKQCDIILANRLDANISKFKNKLYTRDLFERD